MEVFVNDMHTSFLTPAHEVLRTDTIIENLSDEWISHNKSRVNARMRKNSAALAESVEIPSHVIKTSKAVSDLITTKSNMITQSKPNPYVLASLKNVFASRKDLVPSPSTSTPSHKQLSSTDIPPMHISSANYAKKEAMYANSMVLTENDIILRVCDSFLQETQPYSNASLHGHNPNVPTASTCCANVSPSGNSMSRKIYLPISAPCIAQLEKCKQSTSYNHNIQTNFAMALGVENVKVVVLKTPESSESVKDSVTGGKVNTECEALTTAISVEKDDSSENRGTIYINPMVPVQALATPQVLQDLLFGDSRITSSADFTVGIDAGETYGIAAETFLQYGSTRIGNEITLTPSFFKRLPVVVSMSCPQLNISQVATTFSGSRNNLKFGPNHTIRIVEVMAKLVPFVNKCCEAQMGLSAEIVDDLVEDRDMPVATCGNVEHCFSNNPTCGVSAYVGRHEFKLQTEILATHGVMDKTNSASTNFPAQKTFVVHVSAFFSGPVEKLSY